MFSSVTQQLDFILCFYGMAFLLLGVVSLAIARGSQAAAAWTCCGLFGLVHGVSEWLDLLAVIVADREPFVIARTVIVTVSFVLLAEAPRLAMIARNQTVPGRWIYAPPLLLIAIVGARHGVVAANATARYVLAFPGAIAIALVLWTATGKLIASEARMAKAAAVGFMLYAVAAGLIVPASGFWPASVLNGKVFADLTGIPIQLVRGVIACEIALSIWGLWGEKALQHLESRRYARHIRRQFVWTIVAMAAILAGGWALTEYLGEIYRENTVQEAVGDFDLLAGRFNAETAVVDSMARAIASSPALPGLLAGSGSDSHRIQVGLRLGVDAAAAQIGYVLDRSGRIVASTVEADVGQDERAVTDIDVAGDARPDRSFSFDPSTGATIYTATFPATDADGHPLGYAVLSKSLGALAFELRNFDRPYFLVDPHGVVMLTNRPTMQLSTLWPLPDGANQALLRQYPRLQLRPVFAGEISDSAWIESGRERGYARRRPIADSGWSLLMLSQPQGIVASRVLGIIITLLAAAVTLVYMVGRERSVHDTVRMDRQRKLEDRARKLDLQASTDALTGVFNRLKFDQELAIHILKSQHSGAALSLVIYDIDHFKAVNDTYGHQTGDRVLQQLSDLCAQCIRETDIHARWGGEEFVIVAPDTPIASAQHLAEHLRARIEVEDFGLVAKVTCSFGIAQFQLGDTMESLIARADAALYQAKRNGRNRVEIVARTDATLGAVA
jgi:diguanylate cyclase (GGDEF)-like protein